MTEDEARRILFDAITRIAPDSDPASVGADEDLREALDLDSMDFLNVVTALHERLGVDIPERDYGKLRTVAAALVYIQAKARREPA